MLWYLDTRVAGLAVLLLAIDPSYLYGSWIANTISFAVVSLAVFAVWALWRWLRTGCALPLLAAGFCLGLGLYCKILFVWLWIALGLAWLVLSPAILAERGLKAWLWPWRRTPNLWV